ncbi:hypothetical protein DOTSEDRAFT_82228 [Dothistroma septosporum NZE10]|uniref:Uncharacterized protein n=1 Tax=Dothistroma septosporum (strain NZE10 / CBS 128990) TaxID=675120 RepID=N1PEU9_DOTSN|nr:hypothetical protein DOTSEDRAFT_82228 [Dothistroma septosporum NZE10]
MAFGYAVALSTFVARIVTRFAQAERIRTNALDASQERSSRDPSILRLGSLKAIPIFLSCEEVIPEGTSGFMKGNGKGMAGFMAKPLAGAVGVLGRSMKGGLQEVQKASESSVQSCIIASRVAQGYEEWLVSSEVDRTDVIDRWKLIEKQLKKRNHDEPPQDQNDATTASITKSLDSADVLILDSDVLTGDVNSSRPSFSSVLASQLEHQRQESTAYLAAHEVSWQARGGSNAEVLPDNAPCLSQDSRRLDDKAQSEFEAQQRANQHREKSTEEQVEEEVVMVYMKK